MSFINFRIYVSACVFVYVCVSVSVSEGARVLWLSCASLFVPAAIICQLFYFC